MTDRRTHHRNALTRCAAWRLLVVGLALWFCGQMHGQIFPRIEKDEIKSRLQSGESGAVKEPPAEARNDPPAPSVDGTKVLERYDAQLELYKRENRQLRAEIADAAAMTHPAVRDFLEGRALLHAGEYRDAERKLRGAGLGGDNPENPTDSLKQMLSRIRGGEAYYLRMIAAAMQNWYDFKDEAALNSAWSRARRDGEKVVTELRRLNAEGTADAVSRMNAWLVNAPALWRTTWTALNNARQHADNANSWKQLASATGVADDARPEYTPMYLVQRAALTVLVEFWPADPFVRDGFADIGLGLNRLALLQLEGWQGYFEPKAYHAAAAARTLEAGKAKAVSLQGEIRSLKAP